MYRKNSNSWLKHWDFIILDLVALQLAYVSSFVLRMGINDLDHNGLYLNIGIFIALVDICTVFFTEPYHGIMRRGYFVEFKRPVSEYFKIQAKDLLIASCIIGICYFVTSHIHTSGLIGLFIKVFVCLVISGCAECMAHHKEKEFEFFLNKIQQIGKR